MRDNKDIRNFKNYSYQFTKLLRLFSNNPSTVFLLLSLFFGVFFIFSLAPLNGTDEFTHFPRVYQISSGTFWEKKLPNSQYGGYLPVNISNLVNSYRNLSRESAGNQYNSSEKVLFRVYSKITQPGKYDVQSIFTSVVIYPPWAYLPPIIGVLVAKVLNLPIIWYVYVARLFCLIFWIGLSWLAIKLLPQGKWFLTALALLPTSLSQAATIGADGLLNGLSWLMIALVLSIIAGKIKLNWRLLITMTAMSIYLGLIKDSYWLIAFLPIIIPSKYFVSRMTSAIWKLSFFVIMVASSIWFALRTSAVAAGVVLTPIVGVYINSQKQIQYILHSPLLFLVRALQQPFTKSYDTVYLGIVGILTNRLIYLSILVCGLLFFSLCIGFYQTKSEASLLPHRRLLISSALLVIVGTYLLISLAFYIGNTQVGASQVNGVYGRYFLPFLPLFLVFPMTFNRRFILVKNKFAPVMTIISVIGLVAMLMSLG